MAYKSKIKKERIRYAVVGLGYIAQIAVLPAFKHASENSELVALVSDDPLKLEELSKKYKVMNTYSYDQYDECLESGKIDAVYIALPNSMHAEFSIRAAEAGINILCEKPMAVTESESLQMIRAATENNVKLMIAYRLHFEEANLKAIEMARSNKLGDLRIFNAIFTMQVKEGNIRLRKQLGGGALYDIGIYCINAARYLFQDEPTEVFALNANNQEMRFKEVDEMTSAILKFPNEKLATFTCSFGAADVASYELIGTKGMLKVDPAFDYANKLKLSSHINNQSKEEIFSKRDQFAPELLYFSHCILEGVDPEPSGVEGLADVRIIEALYHSAEIKKSVELKEFVKAKRPRLSQEMKLPAVKKPFLIHVDEPSVK